MHQAQPVPAGIRRSSQSPGNGSSGFAFRLAPLQVFPLVMLFLASAQGDPDLGPAAGKVDFEGNEGEPLLFHSTDQPLDLAAMQQQLARVYRLVVPAIALLVRGNVHSLEKDFAVLDPGPGLLDGGLLGAQRLDLGAGQHEARLPRVQHVVVVRRLGIPGDGLPRFGLGSRRSGHAGIPWQSIETGNGLVNEARLINHHRLRTLRALPKWWNW